MTTDLVTDLTIAVLTVVGSGGFAYLIARSQGEKAAQKHLIQEQYRSSHHKRIANETMEAWRKTLSEPHKILLIGYGNGQELKIDFSPFLKNVQTSYFESHLESGYNPLWMNIRKWKDDYGVLVERTTKMAEKTSRYVEEPNILPKYDRLRHPEEYISYSQLLIGYFDKFSSEIEGYTRFEARLSESMREGKTRYDLYLGDYQFANCPNKEKILELKGRVEELHADQTVYKEFTGIFEKGEQLNGQLKGILRELEKVWAEVNNNVPLQGWCEAGVKGKYETEGSR